MFLHTSLLVRGVISVHPLYLTSLWSTSLSSEWLSSFFILLLLFCFLHFLIIFLNELFVFIFVSVFYFSAKCFIEDFWVLPVHWYHLSLSVTIIYHKIFHISISFLYKITYIYFMQKGENTSDTLKIIDNKV